VAAALVVAESRIQNSRFSARIKTNPISQRPETLAQPFGGFSDRNPWITSALCLVTGLSLSVGAIADPGPIDAPERSGEAVFKQACFACHGTGLNGAPVVGDEYDWQDRLSKGMPVLLENTLQGMNNMPPRGACADCSDAEIAAAVRYLTDHEEEK
jgi:cytochrome c5